MREVHHTELKVGDVVRLGGWKDPDVKGEVVGVSSERIHLRNLPGETPWEVSYPFPKYGTGAHDLYRGGVVAWFVEDSELERLAAAVRDANDEYQRASGAVGKAARRLNEATAALTVPGGSINLTVTPGQTIEFAGRNKNGTTNPLYSAWSAWATATAQHGLTQPQNPTGMTITVIRTGP